MGRYNPKDLVSYESIKTEAEKPASERKRLVDANGQSLKIRKYSMDPVELKAYWIKRKAFGSYLNPLKRDGAHKGQIQVLIELGTNQWHTFNQILTTLPVVMGKMRGTFQGKPSDAWTAFKLREKRKDCANHKDLDGRIRQNYELLQRLTGAHQYGYKLKQAYSCIEIIFAPLGVNPETYIGPVKGVKGIYYFRLNTKFRSLDEIVKPLNNYKGKRRGRNKKN